MARAFSRRRLACRARGRAVRRPLRSGRDRHPITLNEIPLGDKQAIIDLQLKSFTELHPDLSLELRIPTLNLTFDLLAPTLWVTRNDPVLSMDFAVELDLHL